ncbi:MAG: DUF748 domain-containing protein [Candidatus Omnitrophica bacterium]|nr:DUF748 domain-containing protein [Candidatus Omnitrophota bacterium]
MKKFFQIIGIVISVILILMILAFIGGIIFLKNIDIQKYRPQIVAAASNALGRNVDLNAIDLTVSLEKGIRLHIEDFVIAENPDFGTNSFVHIKEVNAGVDILAFILSRQITVPSVQIVAPRIAIIRNASGILNIQTLGPVVNKSAATGKPPAAMVLPAILINSFKIENADVSLIDQSVSPQLQLDISKITVDIQHFSFVNSFDIVLDAAILTAEQNFHLQGKTQLRQNITELKLSDMNVVLDLGHLPLERMKNWSMLAGIPLPQVLDGEVELKIKEATLSDKGITKLGGAFYLNNVKIIAPNIVSGISLDVRKLDVDLENLSSDSSAVAQMSVKAALYQDETNIDFKANVAVDHKVLSAHLTEGQFVTDLSMWPIQYIKSQVALLKDVLLPDKLSGKVQATIKDTVISTSGLQSILLDAKVKGGSFLFNNIMPGIEFAINKTDLEINNFSLGKQFAVSLKTSYLSEIQNITFDGAVSFDEKTQTVTVKNGMTGINLNSFALDPFKVSGLVPDGTPFPQSLGGKFQVQIRELNVSPNGLGIMDVDLQWQNGKIVMVDVVPGVSFEANAIKIDLKKFSLTESFAISALLGYESDQPNIKVDGKVQLDLPSQKVVVNDTAIKVELAKIALPQIKTKIVSLKDVSLPETLKGQLDIDIKELFAGVQGLTSLDSEITLKDWEVKLKELAVPVSGMTTNFRVTENQLIADDLKLKIGQGQVLAKVGVSDYLTSQAFDFTTEITGLDLDEILNQNDAPVKIAGVVSATIRAKGQGTDLNAINSDGKFEVTKARLKDLNVLKTVFDKITFFPDFAARVEAKLPEKYKLKLADADTQINSISGTYVLTNSNIELNPIAVEADEFVFNGKCDATLDQKYDLDGAFIITSELSEIMGQSSQEWQYLYDKDNNVSLPVHVSGQGNQMPVISVTQSALDLGKNAVRHGAKKELGNILDKALGIKVDSKAQEEGQETPSQGQESSGSQIIGGILDKVFK